MAQRTYKFARRTASVRLPGDKYPTTVHAGSAWWSDSPAVTEHPDLFSDKPTEILPRNWTPEATVEQATAAPGEKRGVRRGG